MPNSPEDPTSAQPAEGGESASPSTTPSEPAPAGNNQQSGAASTAKSPRFPRRRRRRPRRSRPDQSIAEGQVMARALPGDAATTADLSASPPHRRRRRRHRGPRDAATAPPPTDEGTQIVDGAPEVPPSLAQPGGDATDPISPVSSNDAVQTPTAEGSESKPDARPRRRRRRRRPAGSVEAAPAGDAPQTEIAAAATSGPRSGAHPRRLSRMGARGRGEQQIARSSPDDAHGGMRTRGPRQRRGPAGGRPERMPRSADAAERGPARGPRGSTRRGDGGP